MGTSPCWGAVLLLQSLRLKGSALWGLRDCPGVNCALTWLRGQFLIPHHVDSCRTSSSPGHSVLQPGSVVHCCISQYWHGDAAVTTIPHISALVKTWKNNNRAATFYIQYRRHGPSKKEGIGWISRKFSISGLQKTNHRLGECIHNGNIWERTSIRNIQRTLLKMYRHRHTHTRNS